MQQHVSIEGLEYLQEAIRQGQGGGRAAAQSAFCSGGACRPGHGLWHGYRLFGQDERGWRYTLCFGGGEREVLT